MGSYWPDTEISVVSGPISLTIETLN